MSAPEWLWMDLRCYGCDADLMLEERRSMLYCSDECANSPALSTEIVVAFKLLLKDKGVRWYLEKIGALAVADAMLGAPLPMRQGRRDKNNPDGIRSYQFRVRRIEEIEHWISIPLEVAA